MAEIDKQGQQVLEILSKPTKLGKRTRGPFVIEQVHVNGTLNICRGPSLIYRVNIHHVRPFFQDQVIQNC